MERIVSSEERIRRAEEIYQQRRENSVRLNSHSVNQKRKGKFSYTKKMLLQIAICLMIYVIYYLVQNNAYIFSGQMMEKTKQYLTQDLPLEDWKKQVTTFWNQLFYKEESEENTIEEQTVSVMAEGAMGGAFEEAGKEAIEKNPEPVFENASSSVSQMEEDSVSIKEQASFIKPLQGTITSRFGVRNPTTPTVPKYHTGIDIAANSGTVIIAAMEGEVELVSSEGDYGNHVKITKGDIMTLYAHCKTLYVKQGEKIKQGQQIAEVGDTGNVTGAHLHFEIRKNGRYVNPEYILDF